MLKFQTKKLLKTGTILFCLLFFVSVCYASTSEQVLPLTQAQEEQTLSAAEQILESIILEDMTDGEKALVIHDWVVINCHYSHTPYHDMAYGGIINHAVLCHGYARTFEYLANLAGLPTEYTYSPDIDHAWTYTLLDGSYYYVDPTWDDDHYERISFVNHRHFLFSTDNAAERNHYGQDNMTYIAAGKYEQSPWLNASTVVCFQDDYCYYIDHNMNLIRCNRLSNETEILYHAETSWPDFWEDYGESAVASGLLLMKNRLWFNTAEALYSISIDGSDLKKEWSPSEEEDRYVCGSTVQDGKIVVSLSSSHKNDSPEIISTGIKADHYWGQLSESSGLISFLQKIFS